MTPVGSLRDVTSARRDTGDSLEARMNEFVSSVGDRLLRLGLMLGSIQGLVESQEARDRLALAVEELDGVIRGIRTTAFSLVLEERKPPSDFPLDEQ